MKTSLSILALLLLTNSLFAQNPENLDFEIIENDKAKHWSEMGNGKYEIHFDTNIKQQGTTSASIEGTGNNAVFKALGYNIPVKFGGKKIKLTGYIKTENVKDGWAGLWMRIDPNIGFDNMKSRGIKGTTEWTKYEIELNLENEAETIVVGGILAGQGKIWLDNLEITIDGKSINNAPKKEILPAQKDTEFDNGSNIIIDNLTSKTISNLDLLGRIWGFLKYYHPEIGKGNHNWDYELFRILPEYLKVKNKTDRDFTLTSLIDKLGKVPPCKSCKEVSENAFLKPDLEWIDSQNMSKLLKEKLLYIKKNRHQGNHFYIGMAPKIGNPKFKNEKAYSNMPFPDDGYRLLSLYKYWNIVQYFFPNKHLIDKDWNTCLLEYIPKFINAKTELEYELAAIQIIGDIKDTHANLWGGNNKIQDKRGEKFAPLHVKFIKDTLIVDRFFKDEKSKKTGLELGDIITHINGKPIRGLIKQRHDFYPASNQSTRLRDMSYDMLRSTDSILNINILRNNNSIEKTLKLYSKKQIKGYYRSYLRQKNKPCYRKIENNIGYITLKNITQNDVKTIRKELKDTKGIIVDIRNYPSAFMPFSLGSFFTSSYAPFVKFTNGNINYPGEFNYEKNLSIPPKGKFYEGKVIVIVNEISQSQAEYTAMAFRAGNNVTIIGSTTAGADGNVSNILLPGGLRTMISGIGVYYPDGTETQRVGIIPDIEVLPTIKGIKEGRDELLEKAIEIINKN